MRERLAQLIPAITWLRAYDAASLKGDVFAGLTVGIMLIPQSMAYAMLAGMPPRYGLYASLVPLLVYPLLGSSRHLAVGIVAIDMLIVATGVGVMAAPKTERYIELALLLAAMTGLIQLFMGAARLGFIVSFLSRPVIAGFMTAAPLIIAASQIGNLLGLDVPRSPYFYEPIIEAITHPDEIHVLTLGIGFVAVAVLLAAQRWLPAVPGALVVVAAGIATAWALDLEGQGLALVGDIPGGLPVPGVPGFDVQTLRDLLPTAVTLALVQFMSVMSLGKVFAAKYGYEVDANRELIAVGASNLLGSLARSVPVSGSFSRSAVSERAGGKTALVNVIAAVLIGLTLLFLTPLFYYLPITVLAALIIVATVGMVDLAELRALFRTRRSDGVVALVTFGSTLVIGIQEGILIGIAGSVIALLNRISRPNISELGHLPGTEFFRDIERNPEAERIEGIFIIRIDESFSFANAESIKRRVLAAQARTKRAVNALIVDSSPVNYLDSTSTRMLRDLSEALSEQGVELFIVGMKGPVRDIARRSGLAEAIGDDHIVRSVHEAVLKLVERWGDHHHYEHAEENHGHHEEASCDDPRDDRRDGEPEPK